MIQITRAFALIVAVLAAWKYARRVRAIERTLARVEERIAFYRGYYSHLPHDGEKELDRLLCSASSTYCHHDTVRRLVGKRSLLNRRLAQLQAPLPRARLRR